MYHPVVLESSLRYHPVVLESYVGLKELCYYAISGTERAMVLQEAFVSLLLMVSGLLLSLERCVLCPYAVQHSTPLRRTSYQLSYRPTRSLCRVRYCSRRLPSLARCVCYAPKPYVPSQNSTEIVSTGLATQYCGSTTQRTAVVQACAEAIQLAMSYGAGA
eukprot:3940808-Rhodomonas_salina.9